MAAWGGVPAKTAVGDDGQNGVEDDFPSAGSFPTLKVKDDDDLDMYAGLGVGKKGKKKNKKENAKMSLADFNKTSAGAVTGPQDLPTRPRERDPNEEESTKGLGGAFKEYGGDRYGGRDRREQSDDRRERQPRRGGDDEESGPARSDGDWSKKTISAPGPPRRDDRDRYDDREPKERGGDRERAEDRGPSRADENSDWGATKKFVPSEPREDRDRRDDRREDRRDDRRSVGDGANDDRDWKKRDIAPSRTPEASSSGERPRLTLQKRTLPVEEPAKRTLAEGAEPTPSETPEQHKEAAKPKSNPFGSAGPVETRNLEEKEEAPAEKALPQAPSRPERPSDRDWTRKEQAPKASEPPPPEASPSSAPDSGKTERPRLVLTKRSVDDAPAAPAATDPAAASLFGGARPREMTLEEKGRDWKKEEMELARKGIKRPESEEEKKLRLEIESLKSKVASAEKDDKTEEKTMLTSKEAELTKLTLELDDKVRFSKEAPEFKKKESAPRKDSKSKDHNEAVKAAPAPPISPAPVPSPKPVKVISEDGFEEVRTKKRVGAKV
eukprot:CAMPEP_0196598054 /NCGR_PEP_ID=MMETSP1081-20130531/94093_1 /TAXON_ID=36882 /ORGANISM="Pyramimonas amylifera, Strain CCMP720" /LENGTH=553 /DNA_ID=CAMNT_0041923683 /DNA_START=604 /DNA_END=2265 /DNA_ORIENTATION=+